LDDSRGSFDVISIFQDGGHRDRKCTSGIRLRDGICLSRWKSVCLPNFDDITQSTAEIQLLPVSQKRTVAILKFYFPFRFPSMYSHRHVIFHLPAKFRSNRTIFGGVMTSYRFFKKCTSGFWFSNNNCLRMWNSICVPNFDETSQSMAEIKLLPFWKTDGRHVGILFLVSISTYAWSSAYHSASACQIS